MCQPTKTIYLFIIINTVNASLKTCIENNTFSNCTLACDKGESFPLYELPLYIMGVLAAFWALAVICDTFFVPSLEILAEWCGFSDDVAGATFMAAGGSAPELFTSYIGTFKRSSVGFNTIVGSAVFNVLFVIGACVLFQKSVMKLSAWPLLRDCSYYTISLIVLAIFFKITSPDEIVWWEAAILFMMYIGYVYMMKSNEFLEQKAVEWRIISKTPKDITPTTFRARILERLLHNSNINDTVNSLVVAKLVGDVDETFNAIDENKDGVLQKNELFNMIHTLMESELSQEECDVIFGEIDENNDGVISKDEFLKWYMTSIPRIEALLKQIYDENSNNLREFIREDSFDQLITETTLEEGNTMSFETFNTWAKTNILWQELTQKAEEESSVIEGVWEQLRIPETITGKMIWVLTIIPMGLFCITIPDVSQPKNHKLCPLAFIMSILWIGFVSYWMVEWTTLLGNTIGIPINVMGLTFLAMGTSIPDLISSVIVARQGKADMAISSSIGSNIFDILVGLPLPWMSFALYFSTSVTIISDNLGISLVLLIIMLVIVVGSIRYCKWETRPQLAWIMMIMYVIFIAQDLARSSWSC